MIDSQKTGVRNKRWRKATLLERMFGSMPYVRIRSVREENDG